MTTPTPTIIWAKFGDVVEAADLDGPRAPYFVMHRCSGLPTSFFCETHQLHVANVGNLSMHLESGGDHRVTVWCRTHRIYEEVGDEDLAVIGRGVA